MSERVCQFFLRGRCQREKCEFRHPADKTSLTANKDPSNKEAIASKMLPPGIIPDKRSGFESDEDVRPDSDDESIVSGFTEKPKDKKPVPEKASEEPEKASEETAKSNPADDSVVEIDNSSMPVADASTFIAAAASDVTTKTGTPLLPRRAVKLDTVAGDKETPTEGEGKKSIRRDSKGFERFEDYFSDSETDNSTNAENKSPEKGQKSPEKGQKSPEKRQKSPEKGQTVAVESASADEQPEPEKGPSKEKRKDSEKTKEIESEKTKENVTAKNGKQIESAKNNGQKSPRRKPEAEKKKSETGKGKATVADLSRDWDDDENSSADAEETIESIVNFIQDDGSGNPSTSDATVKPESSKGGKGKSDWVTVVFGPDGKEIGTEVGHEKSVYDLDPEEEDKIPVGKKTNYKGETPTSKSAKKKPNLAKKAGVSKIGNNMYFYTGDKEQEEEDEEEEEEEEEWEEEEDYDESTETNVSLSKRGGRSYAHGRRKHSTNYVYGAKSTASKVRRCGECEGCNREDCAQCPACVDKPKFGGKGAKKQACIYRVCSWKNPDGKKVATPSTQASAGKGRGRPKGSGTPGIDKDLSFLQGSDQTPLSAATASAKKKGMRKSIAVISPAAIKERPDDKELPTFDPKQFRPGYIPPVVKKGEAEYHIIVSGVKDTGLCGKYWSDIETLPGKRQRKSLVQTPPLTPTPSSPTPSKRIRKRTASKGDDEPQIPVNIEKSKKRKSDIEDSPISKKKKTSASPAKSSEKKLSNGIHQSLEEGATSEKQKGVSSEEYQGPSEDAPTPSTSTGPANRSVTCVADNTSQKEVVVECFAPYDDHRWVNVGKERDGMKPDAVQYARALRPPYHLLSFLRIKGNSTKGMSCTDKNTMVFVVLEGEISVILHTTEFCAKKGDSFYIPPKNYYNLINKHARLAELSLIQFQYDGPLPTIPAGSQSGAPKNAAK